MKKTFIMVLSMVLISASLILAYECEKHKHKGHSQETKMENMEHTGCLLCDLNADFSVKETKDGVVLSIKAKKDGVDAKTIQENVKKWIEMKKDIASAEDEVVVCPVMGTKMKKSKAYAKMEYKGKTYYLCCQHCVDEFKKNPEKYVKE